MIRRFRFSREKGGNILNAMFKNMSDEQVKEKIKSIKKEIEDLKKECGKYEFYLKNKKFQAQLEERRKNFLGKCFARKSGSKNQVKFFKILRVLDPPNENSAVCLALTDGCEYEICKRVLHLWSYEDLQLLNRDSDPKMIDFYNEISCKEFLREMQRYFDNLKKEAES